MKGNKSLKKKPQKNIFKIVINDYNCRFIIIKLYKNQLYILKHLLKYTIEIIIE